METGGITVGEVGTAVELLTGKPALVGEGKFPTSLNVKCDDVTTIETVDGEEITKTVDRIYTKLQTIDNEYLKWLELIFAIAFAYLGYMAPIWLLMFQKIISNFYYIIFLIYINKKYNKRKKI